MENLTITKTYANVLKHRVKKNDLPKYEHLKKLIESGFISKKELKQYVKKAKIAYDSLLKIDNNQNKHTTTSLQRKHL